MERSRDFHVSCVQKCFHFIMFLVSVLISPLNPNSWYYTMKKSLHFSFFVQSEVISCSYLEQNPYMIKINELIACKSFDMLRKASCKSKVLLLWKTLNHRKLNLIGCKPFSLQCISLTTQNISTWSAKEGIIIKRLMINRRNWNLKN